MKKVDKVLQNSILL